MNSDYFDLKSLENHKGYAKLQALWAIAGTKVTEGVMRAAAKGHESSWRYQAGIMKGFEMAIGQLSRALDEMEKAGMAEVEAKNQMTAEEILNELRGEAKQ